MASFIMKQMMGSQLDKVKGIKDSVIEKLIFCQYCIILLVIQLSSLSQQETGID